MTDKKTFFQRVLDVGKLGGRRGRSLLPLNYWDLTKNNCDLKKSNGEIKNFNDELRKSNNDLRKFNVEIKSGNVDLTKTEPLENLN